MRRILIVFTKPEPGLGDAMAAQACCGIELHTTLARLGLDTVGSRSALAESL